MSPLKAGPYTLLSVLGEGALGRTYLGRTDKGARVVVKMFRPELAALPEFRVCLREEIGAARAVHGPRVAAVLNADTEGEIAWLATEYVAAPSLSALTDRHGPLSVEDVRALGIGLAEALRAVHGAGTVHRGLTPDNVLITADGPRVTDFGIARAATVVPGARAGGLVRKPGYLAPEQIRSGRAERASDVFALGGVLLYAATWREPFGTGAADAVLRRVLHDDPDLRAVAPSIAPVLAACLDRDPDGRPTPRQVRDALVAAGAESPAAETPTPARAPAPEGTPARAPGPEGTPAPVPAPRRPPSPVPRPRRMPWPVTVVEEPRPSRRRRAASVTAASAALLALLAVAAADATPGPRRPGTALGGTGSAVVLRR